MFNVCQALWWALGRMVHKTDVQFALKEPSLVRKQIGNYYMV